MKHDEVMAHPPQAYSSATQGNLSSIGARNPSGNASTARPIARTWTLWLGPGVRPDLAERIEAGPGLQGHGRLQRTLTDLAELLPQDVGPGRLAAHLREVPIEDIGILRRFLERDAARELVLFAMSDDVAPPSLLTLPRTRVLPLPISASIVAWLGSPPENLGRNSQAGPALCAPLGELDPPHNSERVQLALQMLKERLEDRPTLKPLIGRLEIELGHGPKHSPTEEKLVHVGDLAEELLASLSLERTQRTRFLFRPEGELNVARETEKLRDCLGGLFRLAGRCSTPDSVIRVRVSSQSGDEPDPDAFIEVRVEFPDSPLKGVPVGDELDPDALATHFGPEVAGSMRALLRDTGNLGGELSSTPTRPGRRGIRLRLRRLQHRT